MAGFVIRALPARLPSAEAMIAAMPGIRARYEAAQQATGLTPESAAAHRVALDDLNRYRGYKRLARDQEKMDRLTAPQRTAIRAYILGYEESPARQAAAAAALTLRDTLEMYEERRKFLASGLPSLDAAGITARLEAKRARGWVVGMPVVAYPDRQCMEPPSAEAHSIIVLRGLGLEAARAFCAPVLGDRGQVLRQRGWLLNVAALPADARAGLESIRWADTPWDPSYMVPHGS